MRDRRRGRRRRSISEFLMGRSMISSRGLIKFVKPMLDQMNDGGAAASCGGGFWQLLSFTIKYFPTLIM